jgi:hypothetical protein
MSFKPPSKRVVAPAPTAARASIVNGDKSKDLNMACFTIMKRIVDTGGYVSYPLLRHELVKEAMVSPDTADQVKLVVQVRLIYNEIGYLLPALCTVHPFLDINDLEELVMKHLADKEPEVYG